MSGYKFDEMFKGVLTTRERSRLYDEVERDTVIDELRSKAAVFARGLDRDRMLNSAANLAAASFREKGAVDWRDVVARLLDRDTEAENTGKTLDLLARELAEPKTDE